MTKIYKNSQGFGLVGILIAIVVLGIIGGASWYVWHSNQNTDKPSASATSSGEESKDEEANTVIPADWQWFTSKDKSIKFAYPKSWGTLTENAQNGSASFIRLVEITSKKDFLIQIPKSFADFTWYTWDQETNTFASAEDTNPPSYEAMADYTKPVALGPVEKVGPFLTSGDNNHAIYTVLGKGAQNCGAHHYFFDINESVIHLAAGLCTKDGDLQPQQGQQYAEVVEDALPDLYKYIQE